MTSTNIPIEQLESRLAELELKLLGVASPEGSTSSSADVTTRLDKLLQSATSTSAPPNITNDKSKTTDSKREALHNEYQTIDKLLSDLSISPISGPTESASSSNNAPIVYRRLEVLSSAESMKTDMELLTKIRDLTSIGRKETGNSTVSEDDIVNCSILSSEKYNLSSNPEDIDRLDILCYRVAMLNQRAVSAAQKVDNMVNSYGNVMSALNEKMVLAEEQIQ